MVSPELQNFKDEFTNVVNNLQFVMAKIETTGDKKFGVFDDNGKWTTYFKMRHKLSEVCLQLHHWHFYLPSLLTICPENPRQRRQVHFSIYH